MNKKIVIWLSLILLIGVLAGCKEKVKTKEDVVGLLETQMGEMKGYKTKAEMKMHTGEESQAYNIEVWFKEKDFYRVALDNDQDDKGNQIILKNADGVFVLTPALNKSFKFQTEWPEMSSQPYLFQSLINDVKKDKEAVFTTTDKSYIFETKTNYQSNSNLPFQEIHFNKKDLTPQLVKVLDKDKQALVEVKFEKFELDPSFGKKDFVIESNMTKAKPTNAAVTDEVENETFSVLLPTNTAGANLNEQKEVSLDDGKRVIMTFSGDKEFTLVQEHAESVQTLSTPQEVKGDIVNLGYTLGALADNTLKWSHNGIDFQLASDELTKEELIDVAKSVHGKPTK